MGKKPVQQTRDSRARQFYLPLGGIAGVVGILALILAGVPIYQTERDKKEQERSSATAVASQATLAAVMVKQLPIIQALATLQASSVTGAAEATRVASETGKLRATLEVVDAQARELRATVDASRTDPRKTNVATVTARITDVLGKQYEVNGITVTYSQKIGTAQLEEHQPWLSMALKFRGVKPPDDQGIIAVMFPYTRRIWFRDAMLPDGSVSTYDKLPQVSLNTVFPNDAFVRIDMVDGGFSAITTEKFMYVNPTKQVWLFDLDTFSFALPESPTNSTPRAHMTGFSGTTKSPLGEETEFWIAKDQVHDVLFLNK